MASCPIFFDNKGVDTSVGNNATVSNIDALDRGCKRKKRAKQKSATLNCHQSPGGDRHTHRFSALFHAYHTVDFFVFALQLRKEHWVGRAHSNSTDAPGDCSSLLSSFWSKLISNKSQVTSLSTEFVIPSTSIFSSQALSTWNAMNACS